MSASNDFDRRRHPRLILKAFGFNAPCRYTVGGTATEAQLIDLSPGGARIKAPAGAPIPPKGELLTLDARLPRAELPMDKLAAKVCWIHHSEFGVAFTPELKMGVAEMQTLLDNPG